MWLTMVADWLSQISSISLPPVDRPFERSIGFQPLLASTPATLVERGKHLLREGNVLAARPLLRGAADAGRADAAVALAMSFDPLFVPEGSPNGATANPAEAARWYRRGLKLGRRDIAADLERVTNLIKNTARHHKTARAQAAYPKEILAQPRKAERLTASAGTGGALVASLPTNVCGGDELSGIASLLRLACTWARSAKASADPR
jgi:TPR repeat protein